MRMRHKDVPYGRPAFGEKRSGDFGVSGVCFFWLLFFARAKKSNPPAVREPQVGV
jgi:hypothetical protein